jgi:methyl coenzyme M reductase subunit D
VPFYAIRVDAEEAASAWGRIRHASTREALRAAFAEIAEDVDGQRIVWLRGAHLPQSIALGPAAHGIEIAR